MQIPSISPINTQSTQAVNGPRRPEVAGSVGQASKSFEQMLNSLNDSQSESDDLVKKLSLGENVDLHQVMLSVEENDVNFRVAMAIRDRLVDAYREVMRMQV